MIPGMDALVLVRGSLKKLDQKGLVAVSEKTKVPVPTLVKLKYGTTRNPRYQTVAKLHAHFTASRANRGGAARASA